MKRFFTILAIALGVSVGTAYAQMTDDQVIEYTRNAVASGKSQDQITQELLVKGVTPEQAKRIKAKYDAAQNSGSSVSEAVDNRLSRRAESSFNITEDATKSKVDTLSRRPDEDALEVMIFGHNVFNTNSLSFEPNLNAATPDTYVLGPGDEIVIDIWGLNETNIRRTISPEGRITIPQVGLVQLSGLTIAEASKKLKKVLANKYAGLEGDTSSISVTLGNIRTIQVNVMGDVVAPGTYRLSSFASVFHGLYNAGGVTPTGTLRNIELIRGGKKIAKIDVYGYLFEGKADTDIRLEEGDVIMVPSYSKLVTVEGNVKRPMIYELADGETLQSAIDYAGGFRSGAYTENVNVIRDNGKEKEIITVAAGNYGSCKMEDGDKVTVGASLDRFANMIEVRGYVFRPGQYQLGGDVATIRQLMDKVGGPTEDAFLNRALMLREKPDLSVETISIDLGGIINGTAEDILLKKNDVLIVSGIHELNDRGTLTINGAVTNPGTFIFTDNTTIEDLILRAGGLLEGASTARVDIARRIDDPNSTTTTDTLGIAYSFPIKDGFAIDGGEDFILRPYDVVSVRMSPGFRSQTFVTLSGAVAFPGEYLLVDKNETVSDLIARAGGLTKQAYAKGARITRLNNDDDVFSIIDKVVMKNAKTDSVDVSTLDVNDNYFVAVNLETALMHPHSIADIQLVSGDKIYIPELNNTVRVLGEVMFPNAVVYEQGKRLKHYVNAAGGFSINAKKNKAYIIYANGSAAKKGKKIEPGCTVIVPTKPEKQGLQLGEISAITSASTSVLSLVTLLANLFTP